MNKILFLALLISTQAIASSQLWLLSTTAGGGRANTPESFYQHTLDSVTLAEELAIENDHEIHLFGSNAPDEGFYLPTEEAAAQLLETKEEFLNSEPVNCDIAGPLYRYLYGNFEQNEMKGEEFANLQSFKTASLQNIKDTLSLINARIENDDHLLLNIMGHGLYNRELEDYQVSSGDKQSLNFSLLKELLPNNEAMIHLNVQACFSGHAQKLANKNLCVVSATSSMFVGYAHDELLSQTFEHHYLENLSHYKTQLRAFSCSLAQNTVDDPQTSLMPIIENWQDREDVDDKIIIKSLKNIQHKVGLMAINPFINKKRRLLLKRFKEAVLQPYQECNTDRSIEVELLKRLSTCTKILPLPTKQKLGTFFRYRVAKEYDHHLINQHLHFILEAPLNDLKEYQQQFDCLDYQL